MAEQFLTLMADLDGNSQQRMTEWYENLKNAGFDGEQTKDIPYHISLASFSLDKEKEAVGEMQRLASEFAPVPVHFSHIGIFAGGKIMFCAPDMNPAGLLKLHDAVKTENIDRFPWTPHATVLIDEAETMQKAFPIFVKDFKPFLGTITKLHLCAFWPTREIASYELKG